MLTPVRRQVARRDFPMRIEVNQLSPVAKFFIAVAIVALVVPLFEFGITLVGTH
jgi:hypothetical protein